MIRLERPRDIPGGFLIVNDDGGRDALVQDDHDYPGVASTFG